MAEWNDIIKSALRKTLYSVVGRSVLYVPKSGTAVNLTALIEYGGDAVEGGLVAAVQETAVVHVLTDDVSAPRYQDVMEFDGRQWVIVERNRSGPATWALTVQAMMPR